MMSADEALRHTPLPWHAHDAKNNGIWYLDRDPDDNGMIATLWDVDDRAKDNAKLIERSVNAMPALVEALEAVRETMEAPDSAQERRLLEQIDAALAKAKGESL